MDDERLDELLALASLGEERPAQAALVEILVRVARGRSMTDKAVRAFINGVERTVKQRRAALFFTGDVLKRRGPKPRRNRLLETLIIAQAIQEGYSKASTDRDPQGRSAFSEAARRLGSKAADVEREANRLRRNWYRLGDKNKK